MPTGDLKSSAFAIVKIVVFAPMPMATDIAAVTAKSGFRRRSRRAYRTSCATPSNIYSSTFQRPIG